MATMVENPVPKKVPKSEYYSLLKDRVHGDRSRNRWEAGIELGRPPTPIDCYNRFIEKGLMEEFQREFQIEPDPDGF